MIGESDIIGELKKGFQMVAPSSASNAATYSPLLQICGCSASLNPGEKKFRQTRSKIFRTPYRTNGPPSGPPVCARDSNSRDLLDPLVQSFTTNTFNQDND